MAYYTTTGRDTRNAQRHTAHTHIRSVVRRVGAAVAVVYQFTIHSFHAHILHPYQYISASFPPELYDDGMMCSSVPGVWCLVSAAAVGARASLQCAVLQQQENAKQRGAGASSARISDPSCATSLSR
jgi:hypothetical protein